jgi:hypothetical protein
MATSNKMTKAQAWAEAGKIAKQIADGGAMKEDGEMKRGETYAKLAMMGTLATGTSKEEKAAMKADADAFVAITDPGNGQLNQLSSYVRGFLKPEVISRKINHRKLINEWRAAVPAAERLNRSMWQIACLLNTAIEKDKPATVDVAYLTAKFPKPQTAEEKLAGMSKAEKAKMKEAELQQALEDFYAAALVLREHKNLGAAGERARDLVIKTYAS